MIEHNDPISRIIDQIERGEITMHSKVRILLGTIGIAALAATVFMLSIYLISAGWFSLRASGILLLPAFGARGITALLAQLPWVLIAMSVVLIGVLVSLVRFFPFAYRRPIAYSALCALGISGVLALAVNETPLHPLLNERADAGAFQVVKPLYWSAQRDTFVGTVLARDTASLTLDTERGVLPIVLQPETKYPAGAAIAVGDRVLILGDMTDGTVVAYGIRPFDDPAVFSAASLGERDDRSE